jgi:hypothetical protein
LYAGLGVEKFTVIFMHDFHTESDRVMDVSSTWRLAVEVLQQGEGLPPDGTTGATPTLRAASLASDVPPWALTPLLPTPGRDKKMPSDDASDPSPKLTKVSVGDVGQSRAVSIDVDETARMRDDALGASVEVSEQRPTVIASTSSLEAASSTVATTGYSDVDGGGADADDAREEKHDDDDDDNELEEDDMLARMTAAARGRRASLGSSSNPSTPQSSRRGLPMAQSASPAVPLPRTAQSEPLPASPAEEGWDSVEKRRVTRSQLAAEAKHSAKKAPAPSEAAGFGDAGEDEEDDDFFAGQYAAARDGSRRTSGKHSHSVRQTLQREYAIAAREHQRGGGTGRLER